MELIVLSMSQLHRSAFATFCAILQLIIVQEYGYTYLFLFGLLFCAAFPSYFFIILWSCVHLLLLRLGHSSCSEPCSEDPVLSSPYFCPPPSVSSPPPLIQYSHMSCLLRYSIIVFCLFASFSFLKFVYLVLFSYVSVISVFFFPSRPLHCPFSRKTLYPHMALFSFFS